MTEEPITGSPVEKLHRLEKEVDVHNWRIGELSLWPILRIKLGFALAFMGVDASANSSKRTGYFRYASILLAKQLKNPTLQKKRTDILFFCNTYDKITIGGRSFNKRTVPLRKALQDTRPDFQVKEIYFTPRINEMEPPDKTSEYSIDLLVLISKLMAAFLVNTRRGHYLKKLGRPAGIKRFNTLLSSWGLPPSVFSAESLLKDYLYVKILASFWRGILKKTRPAIVVTSEYYSRESFALQLASNELGIKTADWQHGLQGDGHIAYANWFRLSRAAEPLFPDYFLVWSKTELALVNKWDKSGNKPLAKVIGNGWLEMSGTDEFVAATGNATELPAGKKIILFTLQNFVPPGWFFHVVKRSGGEWLWLFKTHPVWKGVEAAMEEKLQALGVSPDIYSFKISEDVSLSYLLKKATVHLTGWSTCALERWYFGKKTVIVHEKGLAYFKQEIANGWFVPALTQANLELYLKKALLLGDITDEHPPVINNDYKSCIIDFFSGFL